MWQIFGHPILYGPEGEGQGGGAQQEGGGQQQQTPPVTPPAGTVAADRPWYADIPDEPVRTLIEQKGYKSPTELATAYYAANKFISGDSRIVVPGPDAKPEEIEAFQLKLGRPADKTGYDALNYGENPNPTMVSFAKDLAFDLGLSPDKVQKQVIDRWNKFAGEFNAQQEAAIAQQNANTH